MYIQSLEIENLRTFEKAHIDFNVPQEEPPSDPSLLPNVNLLLGDNGSGKTSVLRAAVLAALGPILTSGSGFVPFSLVRRASRSSGLAPARIVAKLLLHDQDGHVGTESLETVIEQTRGWVDRFRQQHFPGWAEAMWEEKSPAFLMVGYGASRRSDLNGGFSEELRSKSRALRYSRVAGLFEEAVTMVPLSAWLPRFQSQDHRYPQVVSLLNELLAPHAEFLPEPVGDEYLFHIGGADLPLQALSDGYRAYVGWIADLLYHVCLAAPSDRKLVENRGVVLVDEVDLHLHPEWQQRVIPTLARALPKLQFVLTSHSPLVVGTLRGANVFVLETEETDGIRRSRLHPSDEEVYGLSADQILTSGHFGLASARDPEFASRLETQAHAAREGDADAALHFMRLMALGAAGEENPTTTPSPPISPPKPRRAREKPKARARRKQ
ncbi:MAG: AAA family ATPase [Thermoanaerobaculia bacterium]